MAEKTRLTRFETEEGTYTFDYLQAWRDANTELVTRETRLPGMHGGYDELGVGPALGEISTVQADFALASEVVGGMTDLLDGVRAMAGWGVGKLWMQPADETAPERWIWARFSSVQTPHNLNKHTDLIMRSKIVFKVAHPRWFVDGEDQEFDVGNLADPPTYGSAIYGAALYGSAVEIPLLNNGNAEALPVITYTATTTTGLLFIRRYIGDVMQSEIAFTGGVPAGGVVVFDCRSLAVTYNGANAYAYMTYTHPEWLALKPGINTIRVSITIGGGGGTMTFNYPDTYF